MQNILLAVDGSPSGMLAAELLARLPHGHSLDIVVLTVVQRPFTHHSYTTSELLEESFQADKAHARTVYEQVAKLFEGADVKLSHVIGTGNIGQTIIDHASEMHADLIVLGAKGRSAISRVLLGSVSDFVSTHASCSVLVVRRTPVHPPESPDEVPATAYQHSDRTLRVVVACDGTGPSIAGIDEISEVQWGKSVEFELLSVAPYLYDFFGELNPNSELVGQYEHVLEAAKDQMSQIAPDCQTHLIQREHVGEGIVKFVEENDCDLLVIGETPRSQVGRLLMGSVSRYVIRHAPSSVWVARTGLSKSKGKNASP